MRANREALKESYLSDSKGEHFKDKILVKSLVEFKSKDE
jgi:uncharacterized protein with ATP-grasp and redox domains